MLKFQIGQNALDVCKVIIDHQPEISIIQLVAHEVNTNWRQQHQTTQDKLKYILDGFEHSQPLKYQDYFRDEFNQLTFDELDKLEQNQVWSISSKVQCIDDEIKHIPMMNFHLGNCSTEAIKIGLEYICGDNEGVLLDSGRFQHYYGDFLIKENKWTKFIAEFLMPTILIGSRYAGHVLYNGYSTLRLTTDNQYKPKIPEVIEIL
ncbi:MAG: hypothetical protein GQ477_05745 [Nanohaloarchaea archaeon]|nr:hypothetical protein [Candidatus Nanohaloarchaea archaeon]